jgi:hypothetical protein
MSGRLFSVSELHAFFLKKLLVQRNHKKALIFAYYFTTRPRTLFWFSPIISDDIIVRQRICFLQQRFLDNLQALSPSDAIKHPYTYLNI